MRRQPGNRIKRWTALGLSGPLLLAGCGAPQQNTGSQIAAEATDPDERVRQLRIAADKALPGPEAELIAAKLGEALQHALLAHLDRAARALRDRDLGTAEAELVLAASYDSQDSRVLDLRGRAAEVRSRCTLALGQARGLLQRLEGQSFRVEQQAMWQQLLEALQLLGEWPRDFADGAKLRLRAAPAIAAWKAGEGKLAWQRAEVPVAQARLAEAESWQRDHPDVVALRELLLQQGKIAQVRAEAQAHLQASDFAGALRDADEGLRTYPGDAELIGLRATAANGLADQMLTAARTARHAGNPVQAAAALANARQARPGDPKLIRAIDTEAAALKKTVLGTLNGQIAAAKAKGWIGAAWIKSLALQAVLGADPKRDAAMAKLDAALVGASRYRLSVQVAPLAAPLVKTLPGSLVAALQSATLETWNRELAPLLPSIQGLSVVGAGGDGALELAWSQLAVLRSQVDEPRKKNYLDRTEMIHNAKWDEAQSALSAALARLNAANDELRPVIDEVNGAEAKLFQLQNQLQEVKVKVDEENRAYYLGRPSPCPDGKLACPQTHAALRWKSNLDYYAKRIAEENAKLERLAPKFNQLQANADAAKKAHDAATQVAEQTSEKTPNEVWLPYDYSVTVHTLKLAAQLQVKWLQGKGKDAAVRYQASPALDEVRQDHSCANVIVKGQLLEPQHASALPEDPTLAAELAQRLVVPAVAPVLEGLRVHAERWLAQADQAQDDNQRLHYLMLAWKARGALKPSSAALVRERLKMQAGLDAEAGTIDVQRLKL